MSFLLLAHLKVSVVSSSVLSQPQKSAESLWLKQAVPYLTRDSQEASETVQI